MTTPTTGNTIQAPPRLSGNAQQDQFVQQRWMNDLYDQLVKVHNLIGSNTDLQARVAALEAQVNKISKFLGL